MLVRINVALGALFICAGLIAGYSCWTLLESNARREVLSEAGLMLDSATAVRAYTANEILPLLAERMKEHISSAKHSFLRSDAEFPESSRAAPAVHLQGGDPQSDQPARSAGGLGGRHHSALQE